MIKTENFGSLYGVEITKYTLCGAGGLAASIINYGATITNILFNGKDVCLGYDNLEGYLHNGGYIGATIGRYGNRIGMGKFTLNGIEYDVGRNENEFSHLHGGYVGFDKQLWTPAVLCEDDEPKISFNHVFDDMEEGYPGELDVTVTFTVTKENALRIEYSAIGSKDTVLNLTNHSYFNLNGFDGGSVLTQELRIKSSAVTVYDEHLIPTGEIADVTGTPFDFRTSKAIGKDIDSDDTLLKLGHGYDHNFIFDNNDGAVVTAYCPESGIEMTVTTDQPAVQLYTSNMLRNPEGKGGPMVPHQGFCLETQHYPDSPNHDNFPSTLLKAGDTFKSITEYGFSKR